MQEKLVKLLIKNNYKISMAESCTGGLLASTIVSVPSASSVLEMSFVTYSNESKNKLCGVQFSTIDKYGVVSENVAKEMAVGVSRVANSQVGVGITGLAGPTGGTVELPVGTVCFGFCINGQAVTKTNHFSGNRNTVRKKAVDFAVQTLIELLENAN